MAFFVVLRHQDTAQIGVSFEVDTKEVVDLTLEPVCGLPEADHALDHEMIEVYLTLHPERSLVRHRPELVNDLEWAASTIIDGGQVREKIIALRGIVP
jgi:hypothetical protein